MHHTFFCCLYPPGTCITPRIIFFDPPGMCIPPCLNGGAICSHVFYQHQKSPVIYSPIVASPSFVSWKSAVLSHRVLDIPSVARFLAESNEQWPRLWTDTCRIVSPKKAPAGPKCVMWCCTEIIHSVLLLLYAWYCLKTHGSGVGFVRRTRGNDVGIVSYWCCW